MACKPFAGQGCGFNLLAPGTGRHLEGAAHLAVDLQHQLDFVQGEGRLIDLRPGGIEQFPDCAGIAEFRPQHAGDVRAGGINRPQQHRDALAQHSCITVAAIGLEALQCIEQLHAARDHGVVLHALIVEAHLAQHQMHLAAQRPGLSSRLCGAQVGGAGATQCGGLLRGKRPQSPEKAMRAFHAGIVPLEGLLRW